VVDNEGNLLEINRGNTIQGFMYKNVAAFRQKKGICYVPETVDTDYSYQDFLGVAEGDLNVANELFETVDWQMPETLYQECYEDELEL